MALKDGLGPRVEKLRTSHGLTQRELAKAVGVSVMTVVSIEKAKRPTDIGVLERLAHQLGTTPAALLGAEPSSLRSSTRARIDLILDLLEENDVIDFLGDLEAFAVRAGIKLPPKESQRAKKA